jgi:hypothetical protein
MLEGISDRNSDLHFYFRQEADAKCLDAWGRPLQLEELDVVGERKVGKREEGGKARALGRKRGEGRGREGRDKGKRLEPTLVPSMGS